MLTGLARWVVRQMEEVEHVGRTARQPWEKGRTGAGRLELNVPIDLRVRWRHPSKRGAEHVPGSRAAKAPFDKCDLGDEPVVTSASDFGVEDDTFSEHEQITQIQGVHESGDVLRPHRRVGTACRKLESGRI